MSKYRKRPVVIDAIQFTGSNFADVALFVNEEFTLDCRDSDKQCVIQTLEGDMTASAGDWIIRGVKGEYYPCKPDIFEATYEALE